MAKLFPPKIRNRLRMSDLTVPSQHFTVSLRKFYKAIKGGVI